MSKLSTETSLLVAHLKECYEQNKKALYQEMEEIVDKVTTTNRNYLSRALLIVRRDYGYLFHCEQSIGYIPLQNSQKVTKVEMYRQARVKSQVNKWSEELSTVNTHQLSEDEFNKYLISSVKVSAHQMMLDNKFDEQCAIATRDCSSQGKVEFSQDSIKEAFKALSMAI